jgi:hypothetical protein
MRKDRNRRVRGRRKPDMGRELGEMPISARFGTLNGDNPKRGRPTIKDNFLLGNRNAWAALLEQAWLKIGPSLLNMRNKRTSTIEDVRKAFAPVKDMPHNSGLANYFYRESFEPAKPAEVLKNFEKLGKVDAEILQAQSKRDEYIRSCVEAERAVKKATIDEKQIIEDEALCRLQRLLQLADDLRRFGTEREALHKKSENQATYVFCTELLRFLRPGRNAINPRNLADALAGLPHMSWRQSFDRCSRMPFNQPQHDYQVFEVISEVCRQLPDAISEPPVEYFRAQLLKRSRTPNYSREFIREHWRDLRLAIEACWKLEPSPRSLPFELASLFTRQARRQKDEKEQILADREKLVC